MPTPSTAEINASIVKIMEAAELADDIVNGPASGVGSDVTVDSGVVPTLAKRAAAEAAAIVTFNGLGNDAISSFTTLGNDAISSFNTITRTAVQGPPVNGVTAASAVGQECITGNAAGNHLIHKAVQIAPTIWDLIGPAGVHIADDGSYRIISSVAATGAVTTDAYPIS